METCSEGTGGQSVSELSGHIKLCVVSITVKMNTKVPVDVAKREEVNNKQERPQRRTLWNSMVNYGAFWPVVLYCCKMCPVCKTSAKCSEFVPIYVQK